MGAFIANKVVKLMIKKGLTVNGSKVLVLGITFKENCPDIRNSKVIDIVTELKEFGIGVDIYDPMADAHEVAEEYGVSLISKPNKDYDAIILAVSHEEFKNMDLISMKKASGIVYDVKAMLDISMVDGRL